MRKRSEQEKEIYISEEEAVRLKNYIGNYCRNQKDVESIFNDLIKNGHIEIDDPFIKYMVPILETKIRIEEYLKLLEIITENLEYIGMSKLEEQQNIILKKIENIEKSLNNNNNKRGKKDNENEDNINLIIIIGTSLLAFIIAILLQQMNGSKNLKNPNQNSGLLLNSRETFHRLNTEF